MIALRKRSRESVAHGAAGHHEDLSHEEVP